MNNQKARLEYEEIKEQRRIEQRSTLVRERWSNSVAALFFALADRDSWHEHRFDEQFFKVLSVAGLITFTFKAIVGFWSSSIKSDRLDWIPLFGLGAPTICVGLITKKLSLIILGIFMVTRAIIDYAWQARRKKLT